ncbi:formate dehydrogenase accessory protein FdhE [Serratia ureilytica]
MSIRIVPKEQLGAQREKSSTAENIPPLLFANLKSLYSRRADRLRQLAVDNPLGDYLNFAAELAQAQQHALHDNPLQLDLSEALAQGAASGKPPLDLSVFPRSEHWRKLLASLIAELRPQAPAYPGGAGQPGESLGARAGADGRRLAQPRVRQGGQREGAVPLGRAVALLGADGQPDPGKARAEYGEQRQFCPVCGSIPVSSMVHIGTVNGLRYLHCNLCESEWHVVRVKCSNCEQTRDLNYWSLDSEQAAVKAESCGDCGTYLKILYQEKDPQVEAVADDLASLVLDARMEEEGFGRSSINPFLFPAE